MRARSLPKLAGAAMMAVVTACLLGGCDSDSSSPEFSESASSSSSVSVTVNPAPNGTDLAACRDGDCEVEVKVGDQLAIDPKFELDKIIVNGIDRDQVDLGLEGSSGGFNASGRNVSINSTCVNGSCRDTGSLSLLIGNPGRVNEIELELVTVRGDRAVLKLHPR